MAMSVEHRSKFAALHRQWWRLHMSGKFSSGTINSKQTYKQKLIYIIFDLGQKLVILMHCQMNKADVYKWVVFYKNHTYACCNLHGRFVQSVLCRHEVLFDMNGIFMLILTLLVSSRPS